MGVSIITLWKNEGRFNYYRAAKEATVVSDVDYANPRKLNAYTGLLQLEPLTGHYIEQYGRYYFIHERAQIFAWRRRKDSDGVSWSQRWQDTHQRNSRNANIRQTLHGRRIGPNNYSVDDLVIQGRNLHFANALVMIEPDRLELSELGEHAGLVAAEEGFYLRHHEQGDDRIGDERLLIEGIPAEERVTYFGKIEESRAVGQQEKTPKGFISGLIQDDGWLHHLVNGDRDRALQTMKKHLTSLQQKVRFAGTAGIVFGISGLLNSLMHLLLGIPVIGALTRHGSLLIGVVIGAPISLAVIGLGAAFHNPGVAILIVLALACLVFGLYLLRERSKANAQSYVAAHDAPKNALSADESIDTPDHAALERPFRNLVRLALEDGKLSKNENDFLARWGRSRGMDDERIVALFEEAKRDTHADIEATGVEDFPYLVTICLLDGTLSPKEWRYLKQFGHAIGMNDAQVRTTVQRAVEGKLDEAA